MFIIKKKFIKVKQFRIIISNYTIIVMIMIMKVIIITTTATITIRVRMMMMVIIIIILFTINSLKKRKKLFIQKHYLQFLSI